MHELKSMNKNDWGFNEYTPISIIMSLSSLHEKTQYLRWTNTILDTVKTSDSEAIKYRHNLFESWIVFFWSFIEFVTVDTCNEIEENMYVRVKRKDLKRASKIDSVVTYFDLVCNKNFPSKSVLYRLNNYRIVRNLCAHQSGNKRCTKKIQKDGGEYTHIEYGGGFQNISQTEKKTLEELGLKEINGSYILNMSFCESFINFTCEYFVELILTSNSICKSQEKFKKVNKNANN